MHRPWKIELRALVKLALPVITVQVGMLLMGFIDTMMLGHFDELHMAAGGVGNIYALGVMIFGSGVLYALDPVMSQAVGAGDESAITRNLQRGVVLAVALMIPTALVFAISGPVLDGFRQKPQLVPLATGYIWILIPSILPFYLYQLLRSALQAYHRTAPVVWTILVANLVNVGLNRILIFGAFGVEPMGVQGSAWATLASRWLMCLVLLFAGRRELWNHLAVWTRRVVEIPAMKRLVRVGAPVGVQMALEFGAFGFTLLMMGYIGISAQAGHQAAIQLASLTYMFPLGISVATSVRVGNGIGRGDLGGARWSAAMGLAVGVALMIVFAAVFFAFPGPLAALFAKEEDGARLVCTHLLPIAAVFQVMDGVQVVSLGALRGVADTKVSMLINLLGFWCLGIPAGVLFTFGLGGGPEGLWWGLTVGLTAVAVCLLLRVWVKLRGEIGRTVIDEGT